MSDLAKALHAFQQDAPPIHLDATNPHFGNKFASLGGVVAAVRPILNKHGLIYSQLTTNIDGAPALMTTLIHAESGDAIQGTTPLILSREDMQGYGSALTYARRYALLAILGLVGDADDDANAASSSAGASEPSGAGPQAAETPADVLVSFGKHKGKKVSEVPSSYWEWWLGQDGRKDEALKAAVELHLGLTAQPVGANDDLDSIPF